MADRHNGLRKPPGRQVTAAPHFTVGQRVVCVDAAPSRLAPDRKLLTAGKIYTVRAVDAERLWKSPGWGVLLEGMVIFYPGGGVEWAFHPRRFRPVTTRPTDITIFRKLLDVPVAASTLPPPERPVQLGLPLPRVEKRK